MNDALVVDTEVLDGRYKIERPLGQGGQALTYLAHRLDDGRPVIVKELRVQQAAGWKGIELFEREAFVLESLDHPAIPRYLDSFQLDHDGTTRLFLVQQYVEGQTLQQAVDAGFHVDEAMAKQMAQELLEVLGYLHSRTPQVIHRDIKPSNIIRRPDGHLSLIDFGTARQVLASTRDGSTVVGTAGYVPTEQLYGGAQPASDLYALGATLVFLLTRRPPDELPAERMKLEFRDAANISEGFANFLDRLLEPDVAKRVQTASQAQALLRNVDRALAATSTTSKNLPARRRKPMDSKIAVRRRPGVLTAELPRRMQIQVWSPALGAVAMLGMGLYQAHAHSYALLGSPIGWVMTAAPMLLLLWAALVYLKRTRLTLNNRQFRVEYDILGLSWHKSVDVVRFMGLRQKKVRAGRNSTEPALGCADDKGKNIIFGRGLSGAERKWLVDIIRPRHRGAASRLSRDSGIRRGAPAFPEDVVFDEAEILVHLDGGLVVVLDVEGDQGDALEELVQKAAGAAGRQALATRVGVGDQVADDGDVVLLADHVDPGDARQPAVAVADAEVQPRLQLGGLEEVVRVVLVQLHDRGGVAVAQPVDALGGRQRLVVGLL